MSENQTEIALPDSGNGTNSTPASTIHVDAPRSSESATHPINCSTCVLFDRDCIPVRRHSFLILAGLITLAGGALRMAFLDHPMRYDESMVYLNYVIYPLYEIPQRYTEVQNHILHTMLVHEAVRFFGNSPPVLRLPAFLAGTALIPTSILCGWLLSKRISVALSGGAFVATATVLVDYSTNSRGYTIVALLTMCLFAITCHVVRYPLRRRWWLIWVVVSALGTFTIPIMVIPIVSFWIALHARALLGKSRRRRHILLSWANLSACLAAVITSILYLPSLLALGTNRLSRVPNSVHHYSNTVVGDLHNMVSTVARDWTIDLPTIAPALIILGLFLGIIRPNGRRNMFKPLLLGLFASSLLAILALPVTPYPRVWLYLLPALIVLGFHGLTKIPFENVRRATLIVLTTCAIINASRTFSREFLVSEDPHTLVDADRIARLFAAEENRAYAFISLPSTPAPRYYLNLYDLPRAAHPADPRVKKCYVVVNHTQTLDDVLKVKGQHIVDYGPAKLYRELPNSKIYVLPRHTRSDSSEVPGSFLRADSSFSELKQHSLTR